ncbi:hypothetical protein NDU88_007043 [Pleurodeles waltl]|uniref:Uncharacterized protein n=1 Tax=Pleurodeles waltl TaxID=8319 RepID=A0AAV7SRN9_PLEWA|nr:hypothetical protein NDU88_007043 [Pleurodeles waltl]
MVPTYMTDMRFVLLRNFPKEPATATENSYPYESQLCQMDIKYGLFEPTRMWGTKDSKSQVFFDPGGPTLFLDELSTLKMEVVPPDLSKIQKKPPQAPPHPSQGSQ